MTSLLMRAIEVVALPYAANNEELAEKKAALAVRAAGAEKCPQDSR